MSIKSHDDVSIAYTQSKGIVYESYFTMKGQPVLNMCFCSLTFSSRPCPSPAADRYNTMKGCLFTDKDVLR